MAYVKNNNPGQIRLELPTANYVYELPLFSFRDLFDSFGVSLIFNFILCDNEDNSFSIRPGYKLNVQKRLIKSGDTLTYYQNEYGKKIGLTKQDTSPIYFFDDRSKRIIRPEGTGYTVEHPDGSKEYYDSEGKITSIIDKYRANDLLNNQSSTVPVLVSYVYDASDKLVSIVHRNNQTVNISYDSSNRVNNITYSNSSTSIEYTASGITVDLSSGEKVAIEQNGYASTAKVGEVGENAAVVYKKDCRIAINGNTVTTSTNDLTLAEDTAIDSTVHTFPEIINEYDLNSNQVEITDFYGAKTRIQYVENRAQYAYEVKNDDVSFVEWGDYGHRFTGTVQMLETDNESNSTRVVGQQLLRDGIGMMKDVNGGKIWSSTTTDNEQSLFGHYVLSGWAKVTSNFNNPEQAVIVATNSLSTQEDPFPLNLTPVGQWKYFSRLVELPGYYQYVYPESSSGEIELRDLRLTYKQIGVTDNEGDIHLAILEDGLTCVVNGENKFLPLKDCEFYCNNAPVTTFSPVYFEDILKNKINYKKGIDTNYFFCGNMTDVVPKGSTEDVRIVYDDDTYYLSQSYLTRRQYVRDCGYVTSKIIDDGSSFLIYQTVNESNQVISSKTVNSLLDTLTSTADNVTTTYARDAFGRLVSENAKDPQNNQLYSNTTAYGTSSIGDPMITETDMFGNSTSCTLDSVWGAVISTTLADGTVITDTYDDGKTAVTQRTIGGKSITFGYSDGYPTSMQIGNLPYAFTYSKDELTSVKKNAEYVEQHEYTKTKTTSYYPSASTPSYSYVTNLDKYRRITSVDNLITNDYDIISSFNSTTGVRSVFENNKDALLVTSVDEVRSEISRYEYDVKNQLIKKSVTSENTFTSKKSNDLFTYDLAGRLETHTTTINDPGGDKTYCGEIEYRKAETDASADNTVYKYTYKTDGVTRSTMTNTYDTFNRINKKSVNISGGLFHKTYAYTGNRLTGVVVKRGTTVIGNETPTYDNLGRISKHTYTLGSAKETEYEYDVYGRLIRENNQALSKTFAYSYDDIGNIQTVKQYAYTTGALPTSASSTKSFTYHTTYKDRLISYGGSSVSYNTAGYVSSYNGDNYSWQKGRLSAITRGNPKLTTGDFKYCTFTYDAHGRRVAKLYKYESAAIALENSNPTYNTTYKYDHSGRLLNEVCVVSYKGNTTTHTHRIVYLYDEGTVIGLLYGYDTTDLQPFYYQRNIFGDVIAIRDTVGTKVVEYAYDAWGNSTVVSYSNADLANYNPIRYRGYYYDRETKLYYCNARYYDPEWRRFLSHDDTSYLDPESVNGLNLYAYCGNDPVNYADPSGHSWESFWNGVGDWFSDNWVKLAIGAGAIALGVLTMGVATLISGAGMTVALSAMGSAAVSSVVQVGISTAISAGIGFAVGGITTGSWEGAIEGMLDGIADGFMWGGIFAGAGQVLSSAMKITRSLAPNFNGVQIGKVKLWSPNTTANQNAGGTLLKIGRFNRIDTEIGNMIHVHLKLFGYKLNHFPIGMIIGGVIGGF